MNDHTRKVLEFDKVLQKAASYTKIPATAERILTPRRLPPHTLEEIFEQTASLKLLSSKHGPPPLTAGAAVSDLLIKIEPLNSSLLPEEYLVIIDWLKGCKRIKQYSNKIKETDTIPQNIAHLFEQLNYSDFITREIQRIINPDGSVADNASKTLAKIRKEIRTATDRIHAGLRNILHNPEHSGYFQEKLVTMRNDRFVIPLKASHNGRIDGIIHDRSASGETVFLEPANAVQENNLLKQLLMDEEQEIRTILRSLADQIRNISAELLHSESLLLDIDELSARVNFADAFAASRPVFSDVIDLRKLRHPLLVDPVAVDIKFSTGTYGLVITGPNTGGKTVTLKTVGLAVLLANNGFFIPAESGSTIIAFHDVLCDIGDEQSIEQNLSTFSAHMKHILTMLKAADSNTLILLDELGAGTDPQEGAALGMAILDYLINSKIPVIATTHYSKIKNYAYMTDTLDNASVEFNIDTLQPTYKILHGIPGSSRALQIAERLGLPIELLRKAYSFMDKNTLSSEQLFNQIENDLAEAREIKNRADNNRLQQDRLLAEYRKKTLALEEEKKRLHAEFERELSRLKSEAKEKINTIISSLKSKNSIITAKEESEYKNCINELSNNITLPSPEKQQLKPLNDTIQKGDSVYINSLQREASVLEYRPEKSELTVALGSFQSVLSVDDVVLVKKRPPGKKPKYSKQVHRHQEPVSPVLDIRGLRYQEAVEQIDQWLEKAAIAGHKKLTIIHGKGTGALREATESCLYDNPLIKEYHFASLKGGGYGVTEITIG